MKITKLRTLITVSATVLLATAGLRAFADQATPTAVKSGKSYTGTIVAVDAKENVLNVRGGVFGSKKFALGENSTFVTSEKDAAAINDLRAGQKVLVVYQDAHGVLAAN